MMTTRDNTRQRQEQINGSPLSGSNLMDVFKQLLTVVVKHVEGLESRITQLEQVNKERANPDSQKQTVSIEPGYQVRGHTRIEDPWTAVGFNQPRANEDDYRFWRD